MRGKTKETDNIKDFDVRYRQLNFTAFLKVNIWIYHFFGEENAVFLDQGGKIFT